MTIPTEFNSATMQALEAKTAADLLLIRLAEDVKSGQRLPNNFELFMALKRCDQSISAVFASVMSNKKAS